MGKNALLEKITLLFLKHGYKKLTMSQMATTLGVSTKSLHQNFGTKEQLISEALAFRQELFIGMGKEMRDNSADAIENFIIFRNQVFNVVSLEQQNKNLMELREISEALYDQAVKDLEVITTVCFEMIHRRGVNEGDFDPTLSSSAVGKAYSDLFLELRTDEYESHKDYVDKTNFKTLIFFKGLLSDQGRITFEKHISNFRLI
mgnify:CR=1 FL=1